MHNDKILDNSSFIQINNLSLKGKFVSSILLSDDSFFGELGKTVLKIVWQKHDIIKYLIPIMKP